MESWVREKRLMKVGRGESWEGERGAVRVWREVKGDSGTKERHYGETK